jgi:hypothetical protein
VAALGDLIIICVVGFVIVAILSLVLSKTPATPRFARRVPTSGTVVSSRPPPPPGEGGGVRPATRRSAP